MSAVSPPIQKLAQRFVAFEAARDKPADAYAHEAARVCEKLRVHLSTLMGAAGFEALLSRALSQAKAEIPSLNEVQVRPDGSCDGFDDFLKSQDAGAARKAGIVLVALLLELLVTFLGDTLTLRLLHDVWPDASLDKISLKAGDIS